MIKKISLFLAIIAASILGTSSYSQTASWLWSATAGGSGYDEAFGVATDATGCVYMAGFFNSPSITFGTTTLTNSGGYDIYIVKYDASGNVRWARKAGGTANDYCNSLSADTYGNIYIGGRFASSIITFGTITLTGPGTDNSYIAKYDTAGTVLWVRQITGGLNNCMQVANSPDGSIYASGWFTNTITAGSFNLTSLGQNDDFVIKYDGSGNALWALSAGGTGGEGVTGLATAADGSVYMNGNSSGTSISFGTDTTLLSASGAQFTVKYDSAGNFKWVRAIGGSGIATIKGITTDPAGNAYITGDFTLSAQFGTLTVNSAGSNDVFVAKYDITGNVIWTVNAGGSDADRGLGISNDGAGNVYLCGGFKSPSLTLGSSSLTYSGGYADVFVAKFDANGNALWALKAGGSADDMAFPISANISGGVAVGFHSNSPSVTIGSGNYTSAGTWDVFAAKIGELTGSEESGGTGDFPARIFPNPATSQITIQHAGYASSAVAHIYNSAGQLVISKEFQNCLTSVNTSVLERGIYLVEVIWGNHIQRQKIILQ